MTDASLAIDVVIEKLLHITTVIDTRDAFLRHHESSCVIKTEKASSICSRVSGIV